MAEKPKTSMAENMALERAKEEDDAKTGDACQWHDVTNIHGDVVQSYHPPAKPGKHVCWYKGTFDNWGPNQLHGVAWPLSYTTEGVFGCVTTTKNTCFLGMTHNGCFYRRCRSYHFTQLGTIVSALPGRNPVKLGMINPAIRRTKDMAHLMNWNRGQQAQIDALVEEEAEKAEAELAIRQAARAKRLAAKTRYLATVAAAMEEEEDEEPARKRPKIAMLAPVLSAAVPQLEFTAPVAVAQEASVAQQATGVKCEYQQMDGSKTPPASSPVTSPTSPTISPPAPPTTAMGEISLESEAVAELFPGGSTAAECEEADDETPGELVDEGKEAAADEGEEATAEEKERAADNTAAVADM